MIRRQTIFTGLAIAVAAVFTLGGTFALAQQQNQPQRQQQQQTQRQQQVPGHLAIAGLIDVATANHTVLAQALEQPQVLDRLLQNRGAQAQQQNQQVRVVRLSEVLSDEDQDLVEQLYRSSAYLQRVTEVTRAVIRNNPSLSQVVQDQANGQLGDVVALDVIGQPATIYVLDTLQPAQQQQRLTPTPAPSPGLQQRLQPAPSPGVQQRLQPRPAASPGVQQRLQPSQRQQRLTPTPTATPGVRTFR